MEKGTSFYENSRTAAIEPLKKSGKENPLLLLDLDDTIKEAGPITWNNGTTHRIYEETLRTLERVRKLGIDIGIVTEQSETDLTIFLNDIEGNRTTPGELFNGIIIAEGGSIVRKPNVKFKTISPPKARKEIELMSTWIDGAIEADESGWGKFIDLHEGIEVKKPPPEEQGRASLSIWEKGPHLGVDPTYKGKYDEILEYVRGEMTRNRFLNLRAFEAGNGTLRILPKRVSKLRTVSLLHTVGLLDLGNTVFIGDGPNDVDLAKEVRKKGGVAVAVGNAVDELKAVVTYSTQKHTGLGVEEFLGKLF